MEIIYCNKCGMRIPDEDVQAQKAMQFDGEWHCPKCLPAAASKSGKRRKLSSGTAPRGRRDSGIRGRSRTPGGGKRVSSGGTAVAASGSRPSRARRAMESRAQGAPEGGKNSTTVVAIVVLAGIAMGILAGLIFSGKEPAEKPRRKKAPKVKQNTPAKTLNDKKTTTDAKSDVKVEKKTEKNVGALLSDNRGRAVLDDRPGPDDSNWSGRAKRKDWYNDDDRTVETIENWLKDRAGPAPRRVARAKLLTTAPAIDGKIEDACWKGAEFQGDNTVTGDPATKEREPVQYAFAYDKKTLYMAVRCEDPDMPGIVANAVQHDDAIWDDDSVELFLDTNRDYSSYCQVIINTTGVIAYWRNRNRTAEHKLKVAIDKHDTGWTAELSIPIKDLRWGWKVTPGRSAWGLNMAKSGYPKGPVSPDVYHSVTWSPLEKNSNHQPLKFGILLFEK